MLNIITYLNALKCKNDWGYLSITQQRTTVTIYTNCSGFNCTVKGMGFYIVTIQSVLGRAYKKMAKW